MLARVPRLSFERHCAEIVTQTDLFRSVLRDSDTTRPVPSCPGWTLGALARHLGGGHRWVTDIVATRATEPPPDDSFRDVVREVEQSPAELDDWLGEGAESLTATLLAAGPEATVWTPLPDGTPAFFARRFAHETAIHRADATLAAVVEYALAEDVALDALDEWMELGSLPQMFDFHPHRRELLGPGRTLHFHATDTAPESAAEWVVDLTGDTLAWRNGHEKAAVAVRGPLIELLLLVYGRRSVATAGVEVLGDRALLDFWLARVAFR
jgi:uncharacterized protein (TIGR03083 family)